MIVLSIKYHLLLFALALNNGKIVESYEESNILMVWII